MENNQQDKNRLNVDFTPPKLPFGWLATTFIAPTLVVVLPNVITRNEVPFQNRLSIALVLLSVLLFVSCIILVLQQYDRAYTQQVLSLQCDNLTAQARYLVSEFEKRNAEFSEELKVIDLKLVELSRKNEELQLSLKQAKIQQSGTQS